VVDLRVCHIQFAYYPGQGNTDIYEYTQNLAKLGVDVSVIVAGRNGEPKFEDINGVSVYRVVYFDNLKKRNIIQLNKFYNKVKKEIEKYDVAHFYYSFGCYRVYKLVKKWCNAVVCDLRSGAVRGDIISKVGINIIKRELERFDGIFCPEINIIKNISVNHKNIFEVPLGANFEIFKPVSPKNTGVTLKSENVLLHSGSLHPNRNLHILLYVLKDLLKAYDLKLLFVGDGPDYTQLRDISEIMGVSDSVIFVGYVPYPKVAEYYQIADIGISYVPITPEYNLQPPLKTVEYLATSLPVVATSTLGNKKFIKNGYNGVLVKDSTESVKDGIRFILENETIKKKLRKNARRSVIEYDWSNIVKNKLLPAYEAILEGEK